MKNKSMFTLVSVLLLVSVLGCSWWNPLASKPETNKSNTATKDTKSPTPQPSEKPLDEKAIDTVVGDEKIGVPECDEVLEAIVSQSENPDAGYLEKAARQVILNKIRDEIKKSIEENKNDKVQLAKDCKELKTQIDKFKAEEEQKKQ